MADVLVGFFGIVLILYAIILLIEDYDNRKGEEQDDETEDIDSLTIESILSNTQAPQYEYASYETEYVINPKLLKTGNFTPVTTIREFTSYITKLEGGKKSLSVAQVAEVLKLVNKETNGEFYKFLKRG